MQHFDRFLKLVSCINSDQVCKAIQGNTVKLDRLEEEGVLHPGNFFQLRYVWTWPQYCFEMIGFHTKTSLYTSNFFRQPRFASHSNWCRYESLMESPRASTLALLHFLGHQPTGQVKKFLVFFLLLILLTTGCIHSASYQFLFKAKLFWTNQEKLRDYNFLIITGMQDIRELKSHFMEERRGYLSTFRSKN